MSQRNARPRRAVALEYDPRRLPAPKVSARGEGWLAEEIVRLARASGVPVQEDLDLVEILARLDVGELIPPDLYVVVAEVLAYLYRENQRLGKENGNGQRDGPDRRE